MEFQVEKLILPDTDKNFNVVYSGDPNDNWLYTANFSIYYYSDSDKTYIEKTIATNEELVNGSKYYLDIDSITSDLIDAVCLYSSKNIQLIVRIYNQKKALYQTMKIKLDVEVDTSKIAPKYSIHISSYSDDDPNAVDHFEKYGSFLSTDVRFNISIGYMTIGYGSKVKEVIAIYNGIEKKMDIPYGFVYFDFNEAVNSFAIKITDNRGIVTIHNYSYDVINYHLPNVKIKKANRISDEQIEVFYTYDFSSCNNKNNCVLYLLHKTADSNSYDRDTCTIDGYSGDGSIILSYPKDLNVYLYLDGYDNEYIEDTSTTQYLPTLNADNYRFIENNSILKIDGDGRRMILGHSASKQISITSDVGAVIGNKISSIDNNLLKDNAFTILSETLINGDNPVIAEFKESGLTSLKGNIEYDIKEPNVSDIKDIVKSGTFSITDPYAYSGLPYYSNGILENKVICFDLPDDGEYYDKYIEEYGSAYHVKQLHQTYTVEKNHRVYQRIVNRGYNADKTTLMNIVEYPWKLIDSYLWYHHELAYNASETVYLDKGMSYLIFMKGYSSGALKAVNVYICSCGDDGSIFIFSLGTSGNNCCTITETEGYVPYITITSGNSSNNYDTHITIKEIDYDYNRNV